MVFIDFDNHFIISTNSLKINCYVNAWLLMLQLFVYHPAVLRCDLQRFWRELCKQCGTVPTGSDDQEHERGQEWYHADARVDSLLKITSDVQLKLHSVQCQLVHHYSGFWCNMYDPSKTRDLKVHLCNADQKPPPEMQKKQLRVWNKLKEHYEEICCDLDIKKTLDALRETARHVCTTAAMWRDV
jgi:hypothetical protein